MVLGRLARHGVGRLLPSAIVPWSLLYAATAIAATAADSNAEAFFEKHVRPLLLGRCGECHTGEKAGGGLSLETGEAWARGGDSGPAIVPGDPEASRLIQAVRGDDPDWRMPPEDAGPPLSADEVAVLSRWVAEGAFDPRTATASIGGMSEAEARNWWAFAPLEGIDTNGGPERIDAMLDGQIAESGLAAVEPADDRTFIRRATYDLTGLPPSPEEVDAFVADPSSDKVARLIDRLLTSPDYGVRYGRHWLDVVRYADTAGENTDRPLPHAWRYRNWVMDAFNADMPYDEFVRLQLAGDLVRADESRERLNEGIIATGYLAIARRFGHDIQKDRHLTYEDVIDNLGKTFLGLTTGCARCHDHKYDPISSDDYYALCGILESTRFAFPGCEPQGQPRDLVPLVSADAMAAAREAWQAKKAVYEQAVARREQAVAEAVEAAVEDESVAEPLPPEPGPEPTFPLAYAVVDAAPVNVCLQQRGDPEQLGEEVPRRWLMVFGGDAVPADAGSGRAQLAEWILAEPLAARVMVNRVWQWHFGRGLVATANDFGSRGESPSHPELLDWLAARFLAEGGQLKPLHRLIMQTEVYRRSSLAPAATLEADPDNSLLARFARRRLSAEELRDSLLVVSGRLDRSTGEAHPFPPESTWTYTQHGPFEAVYPTNRRSAFVMRPRQRQHPFFVLFDGADPNASTPRRETTTVPTQALYFLNAPFFHEQAEAFGERLLADVPSAPQSETLASARIQHAFRLALQRPASQEELTLLGGLLGEDTDEDAPAWAGLARVVLASSEFLHVD